jgi:hypothetical protein
MKAKKNILVLASWSMNEPLMHSYLLPNLAILHSILPLGSTLYLHTWEKERFAMSKQQQYDIKAELKTKNIVWLKSNYSSFGMRSFIRFTCMILRLSYIVVVKRISFLHPFAPGAGAVALFVHFITGKKIIMDSWEPHAESMVESHVWKENSFAFKLQFWIEKKLTQRATCLIAASKKMKDYALAKWNLQPAKVAYRPACVDLELFDISKWNKADSKLKLNIENRVVAVCTGKLTGMYLGSEVFQFFAVANHYFKNNFHVLLLTETGVDLIKEWCTKFNFPIQNLTLKHTTNAEVPFYLSAADFAVNPQKQIPSKRYGTPVKDGEYWAMGLPVVIPPNISEDSEIVEKENIGVIWKVDQSENTWVLEKLNLLLADENLPDRCVQAAVKYRSYDLARQAYTQAYAQVI